MSSAGGEHGHASSVVDFYDGLAADYHLIYADQWERSLRRQGRVLDAVICSLLPDAHEVLDCSCGIGTQAIGLSLLGYRVTGTDISARSLRRAAATAARLDTALTTAVADFRDLRPVAGEYDAVISCDNALPHLLDEPEVDRALEQMCRKLRPGGVLVISTRDYDQALIDRPATAPPLDIHGSPRRLVVRLHDWDAPDSPLYTVRFLILTQQSSGWSVAEHSTRYRAITAGQLAGSASRAGLVEIRWLSAAETGYHQPIMTARRPV